MPRKPKLYLSGDPKADKLLAENPFALLVGMVLDQQIPLERAFFAPLELEQRLGAPLDAAAIASMPEDDLVTAFSARPALHRFPGSMAKRVQDLSRIVVADYDGDPARLWETATSGADLLRRVERLPGFGKQKAKIFVALLGKQIGVRPAGWESASAPFGEPGSRLSVADIDSPEALAAVRAHKKAMKAATKSPPAPARRATGTGRARTAPDPAPAGR